MDNNSKICNEQAEAEVVPSSSLVEVGLRLRFGLRLGWGWLGFQIKI